MLCLGRSNSTGTKQDGLSISNAIRMVAPLEASYARENNELARI